MEIELEDIISVIVTFCLLFTWYVTLLIFNYPLYSIMILWIGMIVLSIIYVVVYRKKKRDMRVLKIRFLVSILPLYSALFFYVYILVSGDELFTVFRFLPVGIIGTMLVLNASVVYFFSQRKGTKNNEPFSSEE